MTVNDNTIEAEGLRCLLEKIRKASAKTGKKNMSESNEKSWKSVKDRCKKR